MKQKSESGTRGAGMLCCALAALLLAPAASAELVLSAPPREKAPAGRALYGPIAEHLSELLGEKVVYRHPGDWLTYQRDMRAEAYDIVFDGPHFMSWRMKHQDATPIVRLPGTLEFYIIAGAEDDEIQKPKDLIAKRVCGIPPPNLGTLTVLAQFPNFVRQPLIKPVRGGFGGVFKAFKKGECRGAVLRTAFYHKKLSDADREGVKIIFKSDPLPNQGFTVSPDVPDEHRKKIIESFGTEGNAGLQNLLKRFGGKAKALIPASNEEYEGHSSLLEGVIYGW